MYVYIYAEEDNFLRCCSVIYFVSGDGGIYLHPFLVVYWFLCLFKYNAFIFVQMLLPITISITTKQYILIESLTPS